MARISFLFRKATICKGAGRFSRALGFRVPNTERICSKWRATSRPRFAPASVITEKFGDRISTHCGSPAKLACDHRATHASAKQVLRNRMISPTHRNGTALCGPKRTAILLAENGVGILYGEPRKL